MTKVEVFHTREFNPLQQAKWPDGYQKVAELDSSKDSPGDALAEAFRLTNSIEDVWWTNKEVTVLQRTRSTSVQDVVVVDGTPYLCCLVGWRELSEVEDE